MSSYYKRSLVCFMCLITALAVCLARIYVVATDSQFSEAAVKQSTRRITIADNRGEIYDCNGNLLAGIEKEIVTVVFPCESGVIALAEMLEGEELQTAINRLQNGETVTVKGKAPQTNKGCEIFLLPKRYSGPAAHLLGYVGSDGHGLTGIEKGFDDILYCENGISISYSVNSVGHMIEGAGIKVDYGQKTGSVTLTIDRKIQAITETACQSIGSGAAVVLSAETGEIRAMVSQPYYDRANVGNYLSNEDSPLINRALYSYNVGSVFKPCLTVAAIEGGLSQYVCNCGGSITVDGLTFKCHKLSGHGELSLSDAMAVSCNSYFYNLGLLLGGEKIYNTAGTFRFGEALDLGGGIVSSKGSITSLAELQSLSAAVANLSIGQGDLLLSPVAISTMYAAIVNGGQYYLPSVVKATEQNGIKHEVKRSLPTVAMSKQTAEILKQQLKNALQNGTGSGAFVEGISAGGKTGTAQTGWKENGRSILNGWFCGFYEGKTETYVIVVLKEDVRSGSYDCAPVFKEITTELFSAGY